MKRIFICYLIAGLIFSAAITGCGEIRPDDPSQGTYATQQRMTAIEYNIFIGKQVGVFVNQLMSRITLLQGQEKMSYPNELKLAESSRREMQEALDSVKVAYPSFGDDENRETTIECMQTAIDNMDRYIADLNEGNDVSNYKSVFQNDINALTQQAGLYNQ